MKRAYVTAVAFLMAAPLLAEPIAYQCAPPAMTNADWHVTYEYRTRDGLWTGSNTLVIGPVDMATNSVVPAHMESRLFPKTTNSAIFFATYEPQAGLKMEWRMGNRSGASTNACIVAPGVNTNDTTGAIDYSVRWKRIVEPSGGAYGSPVTLAGRDARPVWRIPSAPPSGAVAPASNADSAGDPEDGAGG